MSSSVKDNQIKLYIAKSEPLTGTKQSQVFPKARKILRTIEKRTKRRAYIRSAYFNKDKIFLSYFWSHQSQKPLREQVVRLKYLPCALELIRYSRYDPVSIFTHERANEIFHRFYGKTRKGATFCVQIKASKRSGRKELMSIFPTKKSPTN